MQQIYRSTPMPKCDFNDQYETIYNTNIKNIQGVPHSPEIHETISRSVHQLTLKYQHRQTQSKAGPAKSIQQCKHKITNVKNTCKQAKDNNGRGGSAPQTSAYFGNFDQVLETRDGISLKNIT